LRNGVSSLGGWESVGSQITSSWDSGVGSDLSWVEPGLLDSGIKGIGTNLGGKSVSGWENHGGWGRSVIGDLNPVDEESGALGLGESPLKTLSGSTGSNLPGALGLLGEVFSGSEDTWGISSSGSVELSAPSGSSRSGIGGRRLVQ